MYAADIGFTGRLETFSFHGLLAGNTWQPPRMVLGPVATGGFDGVVLWAAAVGVGRNVTRPVAEAFAVPAAVGAPGR